MAYQFSTPVRNATLDAVQSTMGAAAILTLVSGTIPANCAAAITGTVLATMTLPSGAWMSAASAGVKSLSGVWQDTSADFGGIATHFRVSVAAVCGWQGLVSEPWSGSKLYATGYQVHNSGNVYRATTGGTSAASGGPTVTTGSVVDGGVTWAFVQVGTDMTIDNATLTQTQAVTTNTATITAGGA